VGPTPHPPPSPALQGGMRRRPPSGGAGARRHTPVTFLVFDVLAVDGELLVDRPLEERLARLDDVLVPGGAVQRSEVVPETGRALFHAASERGLEGVIAKRLASPYRPGKRSRDWLKVKVRRDVDAVVGGWLPGEGGRTGALGSLLVGLHDAAGSLRYIGRVGTGFDEAELDRVGGMLGGRRAEESPFGGDPPPPRGARFVRPELVCRVEYAHVTDADILRAPAYKGLVADADPADCGLSALGDRFGG
jgi:bifunctional non-homologous end joining protein LigD